MFDYPEPSQEELDYFHLNIVEPPDEESDWDDLFDDEPWEAVGFGD